MQLSINLGSGSLVVLARISGALPGGFLGTLVATAISGIQTVDWSDPAISFIVAEVIRGVVFERALQKLMHSVGFSVEIPVRIIVVPVLKGLVLERTYVMMGQIMVSREGCGKHVVCWRSIPRVTEGFAYEFGSWGAGLCL
jgi:hypothetical protein